MGPPLLVPDSTEAATTATDNAVNPSVADVATVNREIAPPLPQLIPLSPVNVELKTQLSVESPDMFVMHVFEVAYVSLHSRQGGSAKSFAKYS